METETKTEKGFTLIEVMVAVSIFAIVVTIGISALLTSNSAFNKSQSLRTALDNLSFAMETMTRQMRVGISYHCGLGPQYELPQNCPSGSSVMAFEPFNGDISDPNDQVVYRLTSDGVIERSEQSGLTGTYAPVTGSDINITRLDFYVTGANEAGGIGLNEQARVLVVVEGTVSIGGEISDFNLQTTVTQRGIDDA